MVIKYDKGSERTVFIMLDQNDLQAIATLIKNEVEPINKRLDNMERDISDLKSDVSVLKADVSVLKTDVSEMKEDIDVIKEDCEITRDGTNNLGEWVEFYFGDVMPYPLDKEKANKEQSVINFINLIKEER